MVTEIECTILWLILSNWVISMGHLSVATRLAVGMLCDIRAINHITVINSYLVNMGSLV